MKYTIKIDDKYHLNKNLIINKIKNTLNDKRGWIKFGYIFEYVDSKKNADFIITFKDNDEIVDICDLAGLSCADTNENIIYFNLYRWKKGSNKSMLNLDDYRNYVINHEVGHILGKHHIPLGKKGTKAPIRIQQTVGIGHHKPNSWPIKRDFEED
jgi:uncharacterized protein DUF3152